MTNFWNKPGVPHKGWILVNVIDLQDEGDGMTSENETCMMCNQENIRFVHILEHPKMQDHFRVGCVCAEKMTDDFETHREKETFLKNKSVRKAKWLLKKWGQNGNGGFYCTKDGHNIIIFKEPSSSRYFWKIDKMPSKKWYTDLRLAKIDIWEYLERLRELNRG